MPHERFATRAFWQWEAVFVVAALLAAPATLYSTSLRLLRQWHPVDVRVVEAHGDGEYVVVYGDAVFTAVVDDEGLDPGDHFTLLIDEVDPTIHSQEANAIGGVAFGTAVVMSPALFPFGRWLSRRRLPGSRPSGSQESDLR